MQCSWKLPLEQALEEHCKQAVPWAYQPASEESILCRCEHMHTSPRHGLQYLGAINIG